MSQESKKISVEESELFHQWKSHPVTLALMKILWDKREGLKEAWASGEFSASLSTEMMVRNAGATGACSILAEILNVEASDIFGESNEE